MDFEFDDESMDFSVIEKTKQFKEKYEIHNFSYQFNQTQDSFKIKGLEYIQQDKKEKLQSLLLIPSNFNQQQQLFRLQDPFNEESQIFRRQESFNEGDNSFSLFSVPNETIDNSHQDQEESQQFLPENSVPNETLGNLNQNQEHDEIQLQGQYFISNNRNEQIVIENRLKMQFQIIDNDFTIQSVAESFEKYLKTQNLKICDECTFNYLPNLQKLQQCTDLPPNANDLLANILLKVIKSKVISERLQKALIPNQIIEQLLNDLKELQPNCKSKLDQALLNPDEFLNQFFKAQLQEFLLKKSKEYLLNSKLGIQGNKKYIIKQEKKGIRRDREFRNICLAAQLFSLCNYLIEGVYGRKLSFKLFFYKN